MRRLVILELVAAGCLSRWASVLRGATAAYWRAAGTLNLRVRSIAGGAVVEVFAALLLVASTLIEPPADLAGCCGR